ncbi:uncharacterized protein N7498_009163 [Penicillium cinerascens]|uniref:Uncharacterized protein n=1 Tax=Penicillium cinerascens TaxID=70096 RepID=A0A9W9M627_9EURO|nr:uncharacterized protein N7498_009163 [Penicillium cinerascens]KAJ5190178.1 hypothetical protein N7498_009163 [Penicillium cinerascens]
MANGVQPYSAQPLGSARVANVMMGAQRRVIEAQRLDGLWTLREPLESKAPSAQVRDAGLVVP